MASTVPTDGTALLLYHGTTMDRLAWDMVIAALAPDHGLRFGEPEFPGSGESSMPIGIRSRSTSSSPMASPCSTSWASTASTWPGTRSAP